MSDDESDFVYESDEDNFDEEENDDEAVTIENHYYEADDQKLSDPAKALAGFQLVVGLENERKVRGGVAVWKFKSLQNIVILSSRLGGKAQSMSETYKELLAEMVEVSRGEASDAIHTVLDSVGNIPPSIVEGGAAADTIYQLTLQALNPWTKGPENQKLWFQTCVKLGKFYLLKKRLPQLKTLLQDMERYLAEFCGTRNSSADHSSAGGAAPPGSLAGGGAGSSSAGGIMSVPNGGDSTGAGGAATTNSTSTASAALELEVYTLKIQYCCLVGQYADLKTLYPKTIALTRLVADTRTVAILKECGGKYLYMREHRWLEAYNELFEAFQTYQASGNSDKAKTLLDTVMVANLLCSSDINPFDSREARVYISEKQGLIRFRDAFERKDMAEFAAVCDLVFGKEVDQPGEQDVHMADASPELISSSTRGNQFCKETVDGVVPPRPPTTTAEQEFLRPYRPFLFSLLRRNLLNQLAKPYRRVRLAYLAEQLRIPSNEAFDLVVELIGSGELENARVDELSQCLVFSSDDNTRPGIGRLEYLEEWRSLLEVCSERLAEAAPPIIVTGSSSLGGEAGLLLKGGDDVRGGRGPAEIGTPSLGRVGDDLASEGGNFSGEREGRRRPSMAEAEQLGDDYEEADFLSPDGAGADFFVMDDTGRVDDTGAGGRVGVAS